MESKYIKIKTKQLISLILMLQEDTEIDFSFDTGNEDYPGGWYGIKRTKIFDENEFGVILLGYYGGGCTTAIDLSDYGDVISDEMLEIVEDSFKDISRDECSDGEIMIETESLLNTLYILTAKESEDGIKLSENEEILYVMIVDILKANSVEIPFGIEI